MNWADKAEEELCDQLESGEITSEEFRIYMRELRQEARESGDFD